jgi:hypothetical protein
MASSAWRPRTCYVSDSLFSSLFSLLSVSAANIFGDKVPSPVQLGAHDKNAALRQRADEFLGLSFYGPMLKEVREHRLTKSKFAFGGRAEDAFGSQLDQELALRIGKASHNQLGGAIFKRLGGKSTKGQGPSAKAEGTRRGEGQRAKVEGIAGQGELSPSTFDPRPSTLGLRPPTPLGANRSYAAAMPAEHKLDVRQ